MTSADTWVAAIPGGRPAMPALAAELTDTWLVPNGIVGLLPLGTTITVTGGRVIWPQWRHADPSNSPWDTDVLIASDLWAKDHVGDSQDGERPIVDVRSEPLKVPVTDRVRELFQITDGLMLVER